jgi:hypothetical protein
MKSPALPRRALEAMVALAAVIIAASVCLIPGQAARVLGIELLGIGLVAWAMMTAIHRDIARKLDPRYKTGLHPDRGRRAVGDAFVRCRGKRRQSLRRTERKASTSWRPPAS